MPKKIDLTGMVFGRLTVLKESETKTKDNKYCYDCICSCGNTEIVTKTASLLRSGQSKSCGCLQRENAKLQANNNTGVPRSHGMTDSVTYICWRNMKARCDDPNHQAKQNYGDRGITYPESWKTFEGFFEDMGENPEGFTLNRKDVNMDYSKDNCEWVDNVRQGRDRRKPSSGVTSQYKGVSYNKDCEKFKGSFRYDGVIYHLGYSESELELALRYDAKVIEVVGDNGGTNYQLGLLPEEFYKEN